MVAGYSKRSLSQKLGLKSGMRAWISGAPPSFREEIAPLPDNFTLLARLTGRFDYLHFFCKDARLLQRKLPALRRAMYQTGMLWISWPKKSSGVPSDLDENIIRAAGLQAGLVDVKVCAVDEIWSGLKFMVRLKDRVNPS